MGDYPPQSSITQLRLPPLDPGAKFSDQYDLVMLLDQQEQYQQKGKVGKACECYRGAWLEGGLNVDMVKALGIA